MSAPKIRDARGTRRQRVTPRSAAAPTPPAVGAPAELRAVVEAMPEAVLICDPRGRVRLANPVADRLFAGQPVRSLRDLRSRFEPLPAGAPSEKPVTVRPRHLPNRWFEIRSVQVGRDVEPSSAGRIIVLRDVTSSHVERLERRAFLSILSHELRTPITTIYAGSRVLARRKTTAPEAAQEIAADISAEASRLYDVVEDLLVLTRVEQGVLELTQEPTLLQQVVTSASRAVRSRRPEVPFIVAGASNSPAVRADPVYLEQVVRNLVAAAMRFGGPGAPVIVRIEPTAEGDVAVCVLDQGPALTPGRARVQLRAHRPSTRSAQVRPGHRPVRLPSPDRGDGRARLGPPASGQQRCRIRVRPAAVRGARLRDRFRRVA